MVNIILHLPHRIVVQSESRSLFQGGTYTTSWVTDSTEWANCQPVRNDELYKDNKKQQYSYWRVMMRYISTLSNKKRFIFGSRTLHVETVHDPTNRNRIMEVTCREEVL